MAWKVLARKGGPRDLNAGLTHSCVADAFAWIPAFAGMTRVCFGHGTAPVRRSLHDAHQPRNQAFRGGFGPLRESKIWLDIRPHSCHNTARMKHEIMLSPQARAQFHGLSAYDRAKVRQAIDACLEFNPGAESRSRIKRLRGLRKPQFRLRVDDLRVFYDIDGGTEIVHAIIDKPHAAEWLAEEGEQS